MGAMRNVPFDSVIVRDKGVPREYSVDAFLALPLHRRVGYILAREVDFLASGKIVDRQLALRSLRSSSTPSGSADA